MQKPIDPKYLKYSQTPQSFHNYEVEASPIGASVATGSLNPPNTLQTQQEQSLLEEEWRLPLSHRITENLNVDELVRSSMDQPLASSNKGYQLMLKMGWKQNTGLGRTSEGIMDPIRINTNIAMLGLGKKEEDDYYSEATTTERKKLESERQETPDLIKKREVQIEKQQNLKEELKEMNKEFYCKLCNKQYTKIMEYEAHLSSYDHNHKKRFEEMKQFDKVRNGVEKKTQE